MNEPYADDEIATSIDQVLKIMDINNDGFITYSEYRSSNTDRRKREEQHKKGKVKF